MSPYFEQKILAGDPLELTKLVYQRAIGCVREAREHLAAGRIAARSTAITRAYAALAELLSSLRPESAPELAARLQAIYLYMQQRLVEANLHQADKPLKEVLSLLTTLAEAWFELADAPAGRASMMEGERLALNHDAGVPGERLAVSA